MRFYVEGENGKATVRLEMTKVWPFAHRILELISGGAGTAL
jgi:hypothetical protein